LALSSHFRLDTSLMAYLCRNYSVSNPDLLLKNLRTQQVEEIARKCEWTTIATLYRIGDITLNYIRRRLYSEILNTQQHTTLTAIFNTITYLINDETVYSAIQRQVNTIDLNISITANARFSILAQWLCDFDPSHATVNTLEHLLRMYP
jgi:hypothetical protein